MNWTKLKRIIAPTMPALTVEDVKLHLNIAHSDDDATIAILIEVATDSIEGPSGVGLALRDQTWRMTLDRLPDVVTIPLHPANEVVSVTIYPDGLDQGVVLESSTYTLDNDQRPARIFFKSDVANWNAKVRIDFTAGYEQPPADLLHVIRLLVGHYFVNREATSGASSNEIPLAVASILQRHTGF